MSEPVVTEAKTAEPLLISGMRKWPTGDVRHIPGHGIGMSGTSTAGFLAELDRYVTAIRAAERAKARAPFLELADHLAYRYPSYDSRDKAEESRDAATLIRRAAEESQ